MNKSIWIILLLLGCSQSTINIPEENNIRHISCNGTIIGRTIPFSLAFPLSGKVNNIFIERGDLVSTGTVLATLDDSVEQVALEELKVNLEIRKIELEKQELSYKESYREYELYKRLSVKKAIETELYNKSVFNTLISSKQIEFIKKQIELDRLKIKQHEELLDRFVLRSPSNGQILDNSVEIGSVVTSTTPIFSFCDTSQLLVRAYVEELDAPLLQLNMSCEVKAEGLDELYKGKISYIFNEMKPKRNYGNRPGERLDVNVIEIEIEMESCPKLLGLPIEVSILKR